MGNSTIPCPLCKGKGILGTRKAFSVCPRCDGNGRKPGRDDGG